MKIIDVNIDRQLRYLAGVIVGVLIGLGILRLLWLIAVEVVCQ